MSDYQAWLKSHNAKPVVLHELHHAAGIEYVSTAAYFTHPDDSPANQTYYARVMTDLFIESWIDRGYAFGDIELANTGDIDNWLNYEWSGYPVYSFIGDETWPRRDFYPVGTSIINNHSQPVANRFKLSLRELSTRLDKNTLLTSYANDALLPKTMGDVRGISPIKISDESNVYAVSSGPVDSLVVYLDDVIATSVTINLSAGQFTLPSDASGTITADVVAGNTDIESLATALILADGMQLSTISGLSEFQSSVELGVYITSETDTALSLLRYLCGSIGMTIGSSADGLIQLASKTANTGTTSLTISSADMFDCNHKEVLPPVRKLEMSGTNWEYEQENSVDESGNYIDLSVQSALTGVADAAIEAGRLLSERDRQRHSWEIRTGADSLSLSLGDLVTLNHNRFGLSNTIGRCLGYRKYIGRKNQATIEVLV